MILLYDNLDLDLWSNKCENNNFEMEGTLIIDLVGERIH